jgi:protein-disulfide isomerase
MKNLMLICALFLITSCISDNQLKDKIKEVLKKNPKIVFETIEQNPVAFLESVEKAGKEGQQAMRKKRLEEEKKKLEQYWTKPLVANIRKDDPIRGNKKGQIVIVEYSDFECPFCSRAYQTVLSILKQYKGNVKFVYKHLPLSFHKAAMVASRYYEAARLQGHDKAFKLHDEIYENQKGLSSGGEKFIVNLAKKVGLNIKKLKKDANSKEVSKRIEEDMAEAEKFGFRGTPGFLVNGIPVKGAYPKSHFDGIIKKLEEKGKIKL